MFLHTVAMPSEKDMALAETVAYFYISILIVCLRIEKKMSFCLHCIYNITAILAKREIWSVNPMPIIAQKRIFP